MSFLSIPEFINDMTLLYRLSRDRKSAIFNQAPLYLVVMINSKIGEIKKKYNPLNWRFKIAYRF